GDVLLPQGQVDAAVERDGERAVTQVDAGVATRLAVQDEDPLLRSHGAPRVHGRVTRLADDLLDVLGRYELSHGRPPLRLAAAARVPAPTQRDPSSASGRRRR